MMASYKQLFTIISNIVEADQFIINYKTVRRAYKKAETNHEIKKSGSGKKIITEKIKIF